MPIPTPTLKAYEKTRVDFAIEQFAQIETPTISDLNRVYVQAQVQSEIDKYRFGALRMTERELNSEEHDSERMAEMMTNSADRRPAAAEYCHCHAIVSGSHNEAAVIRAVLAWAKMRIDDPRNGCWLPKNTAAKIHMPSWLKNAVPHSRIHRKSYYSWMRGQINFTETANLTDLIRVLKNVRMRLQSGSMPPNILIELGMEQ